MPIILQVFQEKINTKFESAIVNLQFSLQFCCKVCSISSETIIYYANSCCIEISEDTEAELTQKKSVSSTAKRINVLLGIATLSKNGVTVAITTCCVMGKSFMTMVMSRFRTFALFSL